VFEDLLQFKALTIQVSLVQHSPASVVHQIQKLEGQVFILFFADTSTDNRQ